MNSLQFERSEMLMGTEAIRMLRSSHVAIFGIGGVGSYVAEALARSGVGTLSLYDNDSVCESNINRQLIALHSTLGMSKVEVMKARILDIHPHAQVFEYPIFVDEDTLMTIDFSSFDYVVDAIDTVPSKLALVEKAVSAGVPVISCMGAGNKLDPTQFEVCDIYETTMCPLARIMRQNLRRRGIDRLKVVYSKEPPQKPFRARNAIEEGEQTGKRNPPGSVAFVPSVAGLIAASAVVKDLISLTSCGACGEHAHDG